MREKSQDGQGLVEFVLVLPVLLIIIAGLIDVGRLYYAHVSVTDAAAEGARYAAIYPDDTNGVKKRASEASGGFVQIQRSRVDYVPPPESSEMVTVTVTYRFELVSPFAAGAVIPLRADVKEAKMSGGSR